MPKPLSNGIYALIICFILVVFAYWFVDRQVVFWLAAHNSRQFHVLDWVTHIPEVFAVALLLVYPYLTIRFCYGHFHYFDKTLLAAANSIAIAELLHDPLKVIFGRYWPATWVNNNPSLLRDHAYGFHWLHTGKAFASFPSGHTTVTVAAMIVLWFAYPRWRWLAVLITLLVAAGLIGSNYHFVGDVIAGGFLGGLVGYYTVLITNLVDKGRVVK